MANHKLGTLQGLQGVQVQHNAEVPAFNEVLIQNSVMALLTLTSNGIPLLGQSRAPSEVDYYYLNVASFSVVTCITTGFNGAAGLYACWGDLPDVNVASLFNQCFGTSSTSNEKCTTVQIQLIWARLCMRMCMFSSC